MPNLPFITAIKNVSADVLTAEIADLSTYGGLGPARADLALYLYLYKRDAALNDTAVSITNDDPLNANTWPFTLNGDGWYVGILYGFPVWSAGTYDSLDCVYHTGVYYQANGSTTGTPGVSPDWDVLSMTSPDAALASSGNLYITQTDNFTTAIIESGKVGDILQTLGQKIIQGKVKNSDDAAFALFGGGLVESAWVNFRRGDTQDAQEIVDFITGQWTA
jgi:hypothetical protein